MDDVLSILLVVIFYLVATFSSNKKKKARQKQKKTIQSQEIRFDSAFDEEGQPSSEGDVHRAYEENCEQSRIHLHEVTQHQMNEALEGEDPCHAGRAPESQDDVLFSYDEEQRQADGLAQDVLRGVIMSEILTRPCQRAAMKRNGRSIR